MMFCNLMTHSSADDDVNGSLTSGSRAVGSCPVLILLSSVEQPHCGNLLL